MQRIDKTVFLSYRRTNAAWALAISQSLTNHGYDVFFDFNGIASGDFANVIIGNIKARAHFIVLLTPSALDRCSEAGDWLRREIEMALSIKRNIVPLTLEGFDFATPRIADQLSGALAGLKAYNAMSVPAEYFSEAMARLRERYLNVPLNAVLHPALPSAIKAAKTEQAASNAAPKVTERELTAEQLFERGFNATNVDEKLRYFTEAVRLKPGPRADSNKEAPAKLDERRAADELRELLEIADSRNNIDKVLRVRTEMLRQAMHDLEHSYDVTLEALGDALDLKDSENEGHSKRVTAFTIALSRARGIALPQIKVIARAAFLHDIGKMAIPDEVLRKAEGLTREEQEIMREHCLRGYNMLRKIPFLAESAEIVFTHQEHFDGTGYPRGLQGEQIPIGARVFAVADAFDAMTSERPFRKARSSDEAREEILRCSGTQFDPDVVETFLRIPNALWDELRFEVDGQNKRFPSTSAGE